MHEKGIRSPRSVLDPKLDSLKIVVEKKNKKTKMADYFRHIGLFDVVKQFSINKGLILYGGSAIHEILPKDSKIYDEYTLPDFDLFSYEAKKHAIELSHQLVDMGYNYVEVRGGFHDGTYKVFAEFLPVADITQVTKNFYTFMVNIAAQNPIHNYSDPHLLISPIIFLAWSFHRELSSPEGSLHRWEKVFDRYLTFCKKFRFTVEKGSDKRPKFKVNKEIAYVNEQTIQVIKSRMFPVVGDFGLNLHRGRRSNNATYDAYRSTFEILSLGYKDIYMQFQHAIDLPEGYTLEYVDRPADDKQFVDILPPRKRVFLVNKRLHIRYPLLTILEITGSCHSTTLRNGFHVGTVDTILYLFYGYLMTYLHFMEGPHRDGIIKRLKTLIRTGMLYANSLLPVQRFSVDCFGKQKTLLNIRKENWDKKGFYYRPIQKIKIAKGVIIDE